MLELDEFKKEVRKKLLTAIEDPKDRLVYIDEIERLGVAYHFEEEIEIILQEFYENYNQKKGLYEGDLSYVSLRFRLLRQHGFYASSGKILLEYKSGVCPTLIILKGLSMYISLWVTPPIVN